MFISIPALLLILLSIFYPDLINGIFKLLFETTKFGVELVCAAGSKDGEETGPATFKKFINGVIIFAILFGLIGLPIVYIINRIS